MQQRDVSRNQAASCPKCGHPFRGPATEPSVKAKSGVGDGVRLGCGMFIVLPILLIVGAIALVGTCSSLSNDTPTAAATGDADPSGTTEPSSPWMSQVTTNPLDDSQRVVLVAESDAVAGFGDRVALILRCESNKTEAFIRWHDYLGLDDIRVTTRLGEQEAQTQTWTVSTDREASFYPGSPIPWIRAMTEVETLVVQTTPYGENPVTAQFDVRGLAEELAPLREACNW